VDNLMYVKVTFLSTVEYCRLLNVVKEDIIIPHVSDAFKVVLTLYNEHLVALYIL
jgi:hypothetical protein